ncbi:hypothetical protein QMT17_19690 [Cronobacter turicensis]|nr:hypothetical protein [Cronobacter turicensis]MDK1220959.1 hypothetical protein [Cronobacter turicensis]
MIITPGCIQLGNAKPGVPVLNRYAPVITEAGYNGRRGDGLLSSQGWQLTNVTETVSDNPDGLGGHVVALSKTRSGISWRALQEIPDGSDLIRYGGKLRCCFRITTPGFVSGRYAFAFYWRINADSLPEGVQLDNNTLSGAAPFVVSCTVTTDSNRNIILSRHTSSLQKICDLGPFDNEWHELILDFPGGNSVSITPHYDGTALTPFNMTWSRATTQENQLTLTDITSGVTYVTEFASFTMYVCRDNGTVTISDEDTSGYVYFSEQHTGGRVVLPDAAISAGNTIDIVNSGAPVMVKPAKNNVLLKVPGNSDALPSAFMLTGSGQLVQSG